MTTAAAVFSAVVWAVIIGLSVGHLVARVRLVYYRRKLRRSEEWLVAWEAERVAEVAALVRADCPPMSPARLAEVVSHGCESTTQMGLPDE